MIRRDRTVLLTLGLALVAPVHAADNPVIFHDLDLLTQALGQGRALTDQDILGIFHVADSGVRVGQRLRFHAFAQPGIEQLDLGTMENSDALSSLDLVLSPNDCVNAKATIKRYDLRYSPPPDPAPYAHALGFDHEYGSRKNITTTFEVTVPVQPDLYPIDQLNDASCVTEIVVSVYSPPLPRPEPPVFMEQLRTEPGHHP